MGNEVQKGLSPSQRPEDDSSPQLPISCIDASIAPKLPGLSDDIQPDINNNNNNMNNPMNNNINNNAINNNNMNNNMNNNNEIVSGRGSGGSGGNIGSNTDESTMTPYLVYIREYNRVLFEQMMQDQKKNKGYGSNLDQFAAFAQYKVSKENHVPDIELIFKTKKQLGFGDSSKVYLAEHIETKHMYAVKAMVRRDKYNPKLFLRELTILEQIRHHPGIVQCFDAYMCPTHYYIALEFCSGGSFFDKIKKDTSFSEKQTSKYIIQILDAVDYMHVKNIVHKDIKPGNIMFDKKGRKGRLRLIDFGTSEIVENEKYYPFDGIGTYTFVPPEFDRARKGWEIKKGDVWAIGIITYILIVGLIPFNGRDNKDIYKKIKNYNGKLAYPANINMSKDCINFILRLLHKKVENRLTAKQAMKHPFIGGPAKRVLLDDNKNKKSSKIKNILSNNKSNNKKDDNEVILLSHHSRKKRSDDNTTIKFSPPVQPFQFMNTSMQSSAAPVGNQEPGMNVIGYGQQPQQMEQQQMHIQQQQQNSMMPVMGNNMGNNQMMSSNLMSNNMRSNMDGNSMVNNMVNNPMMNSMGSNSMFNSNAMSNNMNMGGMNNNMSGQMNQQQYNMLMYQQQQQAMFQNFQQQNNLRSNPPQQQKEEQPPLPKIFNNNIEFKANEGIDNSLNKNIMKSQEGEKNNNLQQRTQTKELSFKTFFYANCKSADMYYQYFVDKDFNDLEILMEFEKNESSENILVNDCHMNLMHVKLFLTKTAKLKEKNIQFHQWLSRLKMSKYYEMFANAGIVTLEMCEAQFVCCTDFVFFLGLNEENEDEEIEKDGILIWNAFPKNESIERRQMERIKVERSNFAKEFELEGDYLHQLLTTNGTTQTKFDTSKGEKQ